MYKELRFIIAMLFISFSAVAQHEGGNSKSIDFIINSEKMSESFAKVQAIKNDSDYLSQSQASELLISKQYKRVSLELIKYGKTQLKGEDIYKLMLPSTVVVITNGLRATGYLISEDGICVTNYHVLQMYANNDVKRDGLIVLNSDNEPFMVTDILATSPENDLAIIKINTQGKKFKPLALGSHLTEGSPVYVLSHPSHITYYFSEGIVTKNFIRNPEILKEKEACFMAISADYGIGASGAPVVDQKGNLVGTVSMASALYGDAEHQINPQMVLRNTIPVIALKQLIQFIN